MAPTAESKGSWEKEITPGSERTRDPHFSLHPPSQDPQETTFSSEKSQESGVPYVVCTGRLGMHWGLRGDVGKLTYLDGQGMVTLWCFVFGEPSGPAPRSQQVPEKLSPMEEGLELNTLRLGETHRDGLHLGCPRKASCVGKVTGTQGHCTHQQRRPGMRSVQVALA